MNSALTVILPFDSKDQQKDYTLDLLKALDTIKASGQPSVLSLENRTYHFYPDKAFEKYYSPSNNDGSLQKITFPILGINSLTIEGNGATLLFHGRISPFVIDESTDITITNLKIDYTRPFYSQGLIIDSDEKGLVLEFDKLLFPHRVQDGNLIFFDENWENDLSDILPLIQEYDPKTKAPGYNTPTLLGKFGKGTQVTDSQPAPIFEFDVILLDENDQSSKIRLDYIKTAAPYVFKKGNVLTIQHEKRHNSAFFITDSKNVKISNVRIVTAGSMGVIAQTSENITLDGLDISIGEESKGLISVNADATHFVNCTGTVTIENCILENMLDDGTNIHGIYTLVDKINGTREMLVRIAHFQQFGLNIYKPGDTVSLFEKASMKKLADVEIESSAFANDDESVISLVMKQDLPQNIKLGNLVENAGRMPDAILRNNRTGGNRPRGFLISTPGKVIIENNLFWNSLYAIHITGDANFWFESGPVKDVLIQNNKFMDCCYMAGDYVIAVTPEFEISEGNDYYYHENIRITGNHFETFKKGLLMAYSVNNLVFKENTYRQTFSYLMEKETEQFDIRQCNNCDTEEARTV